GRLGPAGRDAAGGVRGHPGRARGHGRDQRPAAGAAAPRCTASELIPQGADQEPDQLIYAEWRFQRNLLRGLLEAEAAGHPVDYSLNSTWQRLEALSQASRQIADARSSK